MNAIRFITAVTILVILSVVLQFVIDPFAPGNSAFELGQSLNRVVGGILAGFVIWGLTWLIRGRDKAPEMSGFIFYAAAVFVALHAAYILFMT